MSSLVFKVHRPISCDTPLHATCSHVYSVDATLIARLTPRLVHQWIDVYSDQMPHVHVNIL